MEPEAFADGSEVLDGQIRYNDCKIRIAGNMDKQRTEKVFLHEVFHGIADAMQIKLDETDTDRMATGFYQLYKANPDLFK
jgi:hypothetical protein